MLILSRRQGERLIIDLAEGVDEAMTVGELFFDGPIEITVLGLGSSQARIGIAAPQELVILRDELDNQS
ncbi:MAG: carbon storage regulator [Thiohalobacteraceae bacterium]